MMDNIRKKTLKEQYAETRREMGVLLIRRIETNQCFLLQASDVNGKKNSLLFQLNMDTHMCKSLQEDWKRLSEDAFEVCVYETLAYDKENPDRDYKQDLKALKQLCTERLLSEGCTMY